ncbi:phage tail length tape measure family protein [Methylorubrum extorquens]|uniref:phage tail length tape measure family protein n=1 Tax=Methylorubrum extorquens TaxID=408 RepID=UPI002238B696|nr:phage tail length tape measure family protein [Methylorubrum extorquens]UYW32520.1 phage tail length tape measure family protein [Methylorubrum extorquens]
MPTNIAVRIQAEGGAELRRTFEEAGRAGQDAFRQVGTAADQAGAATDRLTQKARDAASAAQRTASAPSAGQPTASAATMREVERVRSRLDEEYRNARQLDRDLGVIERGTASGSLSADYAARLRGLAETRYGGPGNDNSPTRRGLDAYQRRDLMYQGGDVVASLGSGAGIGTVAFQQGPQILQGLAGGEGGLSGGLKALGQSALSLVTPLTVTATAVTALGGAFLYAGTQADKDREVLERATQGIGRMTGATTGQLDALARANAEAGKVSTSTAREIVAGYASTGQIALPVIADLTRVTSDYARLLQIDVAAATSDLARMFADPAAGADELAKRIGGLDDRTRQFIQTQMEQGDRSGAQATAADYLRSTIEANTSATTGWAAAWDRAKAAADGYWEAAKRIAGIKLGIVPEGAEAALDRLNKEVENVNARRKAFGQQPLELGSSIIANRDAAAIVADTQRREAEAKAAEERASSASRIAGDIARNIDPQTAAFGRLRKQQSDLRDALADPLARNKLADFDQTETAYRATTRAIESLTDANGKLVSSEEMVRRQDQLRLDAVKAKTAAEKADVAERQKAFDLVGKTITGSDARGQVERAGILARAETDSKKGGGADKEKRDDYDRAVRSTEDRIRRASEQAETYGMGAEAIERYRVQTELLTAAQRAGRDVTPELTRQIEDYANKAGDAAKRNEEARESLRDVDNLRGVGSDGVRSLVRDLGDARSGADILGNALGRVKQRVLDLASDSVAELLFGKRGSAGSGMLGGGGGIGSLISGLFGGGGGDSPTGGVRLFDIGGFTGHGERYDVAGLVHRGEVVFSQDDVARHGGVAAVEVLRRSGGLRGYDSGGIVGRDAFTVPSAAAMRPANGNGVPTINFIDQRPAGSPEMEPAVKRRSDGSLDVIVRTVEGRMGQRAAGGQGPFKQAAGGAGFRNG